MEFTLKITQLRLLSVLKNWKIIVKSGLIFIQRS